MKTQNFAPGSVSFVPKHARGDREFNGNGPDIYCSVKLVNCKTKVDAVVFMSARETKSGWTTAEESKIFTLFEADPGLEIVRRIIGPAENSYSYRDDDHKLDRFAGSGPVKSFMGDGEGDDAGVHTRVEVAFNNLRFELKENKDCISDATIATLAANNLISNQRMTKWVRLRPELREKIETGNN